MPAPSKSFTVIVDGDVDPDSPLTTGLMTALRDNDIHLEEWLGLSFVAAQDHNHDGVNSALIAATGASLFRSHFHEIHDHFMYATAWLTNTGNPNWAHSGATATVTVTGLNAHYAVFSASGDTMTGRGIFRIEIIKLVLEFGMKIGTAGTAWGTNNRIGIRGSTRGADFVNVGIADNVRCETRGSGGGSPQQTTAAIGGGGVDAWHKYRIDLTNPASTVFSIDGTVVATHSSVVPDAQDISVEVSGDNAVDMWVDYVKLYATQQPSDSSA